jgi:hypothetical protein
MMNILHAESITNRALLKACKDKTAGPLNFCYGFIIATSNAAQFYRNIVDVQDEYVDICFPTNISNKDLVDLYMSWVEKNPAVIDSPAFIGVSTSFSIKYSCSAKREAEPTN